MLTLSEYLELARPIAWGAAEVLLKYYQAPNSLEIRHKSAEEGDVTSADIAANDFILTALQSQLGTTDFAYLSEETIDDSDRLDHEWVWAIDPMDGTSDFINRTGEFAVHIGLSYRQRPVLGLVAVPVAGKLFSAIKGGGAYVETKDGIQSKIQVSTKTEMPTMIAIASRSHRSPALDFILGRLPKTEELAVGSIGGKLSAIASGTADYYISLSGKSAPKDWDYCAPEIILTEAGGQLTHFDGTELTYNNPDITQWGNIIASNGHIHTEICQLSQDILRMGGYA
jgi:3'(2'), 5'-bisphosphate nucleotidase